MAKLKSGIQIEDKSFARIATRVKNLENLASKEELGTLFEDVAKDTVFRMRKDVRKDTKKLKNSIEYSKKKDGVEFTASAVDPDTGEDYASLQDTGGRHFAHTPYFKKNILIFIATIQYRLQSRIAQAGGYFSKRTIK